MIVCPLALLIAHKNDQEGRRGHLRWSYRKIGEELGLSPSVMNNLNKGGFDRIDTLTIEKLCGFFEIGIEQLLKIVPDDADAIKRKADRAQRKKKEGDDEWTLNKANLTA